MIATIRKLIASYILPDKAFPEARENTKWEFRTEDPMCSECCHLFKDCDCENRTEIPYLEMHYKGECYVYP